MKKKKLNLYYNVVRNYIEIFLLIDIIYNTYFSCSILYKSFLGNYILQIQH